VNDGAAEAELVAFLLMYEEGFEGRFQPMLSAVRDGASLDLAAAMEPEESEAAMEASLEVGFVVEKLELAGKLPKASLGLFFTSY